MLPPGPAGCAPSIFCGGFAPPAGPVEDFPVLSVRMLPKRTPALVKTCWVLKSAKISWPSLRELRSAASFTRNRKDWPLLFTFAVTTPVAALMLVTRQGVMPAFPFNTCGAALEARLPKESAKTRNTKPRGPKQRSTAPRVSFSMLIMAMPPHSP